MPITARQLAEVVSLVRAETISGKQAKEVYARLREANAVGGAEESAEGVVRSLGMAQVSDASVIESACRAVMEANPKQVLAYRGGKKALLGFFVGLVMKETRGSANPAMVNATLTRLLDTP
jgi:aspartyl-tRNA(Asn)/glutamyl-tRNA(Gln) amidotransferase subunit B